MSFNLPPITKSKPVIITGALSIGTLLYKAVDAASNAEFVWQKLGLNADAARFLGSTRTIDFMVAISLLGLVISLLYQTNRNMVSVTRAGTPTREQLPERRLPRSLPSPDKKVVVNVTPEYVMSLCTGQTAVQAQKSVGLFLGKWIPASGIVEDVSEYSDRWEVQLRMEPIDSFRTIVARFRDETMFDHVSVLPKGKQVEVFGKIDYVRTTVMALENCELKGDES
jgi:hypothetical protein